MRRRGLARRALGYVAALAFVFVVWEAASLALHSPALPTPVAAGGDFARLFVPELLPNLLVSAYRVLGAVAIASAVAVPLGLVLGRTPKADAVFAPVVFLLYPVPWVVMLPVFLVLLGIGDAPKIALITVIVFFQLLVTSRDAAKAIPAASVLSMRSLGATRTQIFRHVVVPAALPDIFTALRIASGTAIAVLFLSETVAGTSGLGWYIIDAWGRIDYGSMFAGILALALLGVVFYEVLEAAERWLTPWTRAGR